MPAETLPVSGAGRPRRICPVPAFSEAPGGRRGYSPARHRQRRYRLDPDVDGARAVHDDPRARALLRRPRAQKNVLSVLMQCLALTALLSLVWLVVGYRSPSIRRGWRPAQGGRAAFVGGLGRVMLAGVGADTLFGSIPEVLFFAFQCTFAVITPALILGAFAERMQVLGRAALLRALARRRLRADLPHDLGRRGRPFRRPRRLRFRRRDRRPHHRRRRRASSPAS